MHCSRYKLIFLTIIPFCCSQEVCVKEAGNNCTKPETNKYSEDINKFSKLRQLYQEARESYIPCDEEKCNCHAPVISENLKIFKKGISKNAINAIKSKGTKYQIVNHQLYREKTCMFPARCTGIEHFLLKLLPKLPNMELIINTRDWPQIHKKHGLFGPVFSFSKTADYHDIMYPAWSFWEGGPAISLYPKGIGRWDILRDRLAKKANQINWNEKSSQAFFRGSRTSAERDALVLLSRQKPDLVDAKYTKNQAWKSEADTLYEAPAPEVSFEDHCRYKYLFNFRGVAASFRFKHLLLCKSVVFHVGDEWQEFFYPVLKPWVHYVPVEANASKEQIEKLLDFIKNNDDIAKEIAENGFNMIWNNLKMSDVTCYWRKLLKKYAALLQFEVKLDEDLIQIKN